jgi:FHS family L-fucose permease-like MFS transporter
MKKPSLLRSSNGTNYLIPFILVASCFALWGFANDITHPMVKAFSKIFRMSVTDGTLIQVAFYGGYFAMALPAALFVNRFSYKSGIILGLGLYAFGALMFIPACRIGSYYPFLIAYFILTCGLSFLETSANPYILSMGDSSTATQRLNLAQSFNPIGSLMGMYAAIHFIQARLNPLSTEERACLGDVEFEIVKSADLSILSNTYAALGCVILAVFILMLLIKMPKGESNERGNAGLRPTMKRLIANARYREGVIAQFFYVGVQIMCWTFIIQYGTRVFMAEGMSELQSEVLSQKFNIAAMALFCVSRFICTYLLKFFNPGKLLSTLASVAFILTIGVIAFQSRAGVYCLVGISACMSLMFPTIYGIALEGVGDDAKIGAAGLIMAILGGSILPPLQARIIDMGIVMNMPAVNISFILPAICFAVVVMYGVRTSRR